MTTKVAVSPVADEQGWRPPAWASPVSLLICVLGIAVASYLTYAHFTDPRNLACSDTGVVNCTKVTTSAQSRFLGMPVAVLGLAYFVGMAVLCTTWFWRRPERWIRMLRLLGAVGGVAMILYLIYAELFIIDAICLYCTIVHALTLLLFAAICAATLSGSHHAAAADVSDYDDFEDDLDDDADDVAESRNPAADL